MIIRQATPADEVEIESVLDAAFGPGRHLKTAYRVRQGMAPIAALSFVAEDEAAVVVGSIQCWPVELRLSENDMSLASQKTGAGSDASLIAAAACSSTYQMGADEVQPSALPLIMLGPVAVLPGLQRGGVGKALVYAALEVADRLSLPPMMLIGDAEYYERFGFSAEGTQLWNLPGPFDRDRLLLRNVDARWLPSMGSVAPFSGADLTLFGPQTGGGLTA